MELVNNFTWGVLALRLAAILAGVALCLFGYRLFARTAPMPGNAELSIKDVLKLNLNQVGPGVFFSAFGTAILIYGIARAPRLEVRAGGDASLNGTPANAGVSPSTTVVEVAGARAQTEIQEDHSRLLEVREQVRFLNRLAETGSLSPQDRIDLPRLTRDIKLSLMRSVWNDSWGDPLAFSTWARDPGTGVATVPAKYVFESR